MEVDKLKYSAYEQVVEDSFDIKKLPCPDLNPLNSDPTPKCWKELVKNKQYPIVSRRGRMIKLKKLPWFIYFKIEAPKSLIKAVKDWEMQFGILISKGLKKSETGQSYYAYKVIFKRDKEDRVLRNIWDWQRETPAGAELHFH